MNERQKRVCKSVYKPSCYILSSFPRKDPKEHYGEYKVKTTISFLYDTGEYAAEWEPEYGPIQVWHKCDENSENATEHYYYDFTDSSALNWSQLAVDRYGLPQAAHRGDWDYIFAVLKDWSDGR